MERALMRHPRYPVGSFATFDAVKSRGAGQITGKGSGCSVLIYAVSKV